MSAPLQPVVFTTVLYSITSALIILHSVRNKRFLRCSAADEEKDIKRSFNIHNFSETKQNYPAADFRGV